MKALIVDKATSGAMQTFVPGKGTTGVFGTVTDAVLDLENKESEIILAYAVTEVAYVVDEDPSVPADLDSGHYIPEGANIPLGILGRCKVAVKGTMRYSK